ncbi:hypothetical protein A6A04_17100 [Paramagnetospirillum marisnigri]|uniref:Uncharacterized protein n=1 Tax=Paramagnetospirillum marisnigri TaxID=1285242 RepID=A0A178MRZ2_9PROT|nr:hypothetical protein [Paramagnetospirillum marisnigri]OAN50817.1 hypothetical protein A6A04_17100 [Paramagnetospirillum marisnigri]
MTLRDLAMALVWGGAALLLAVLIHRFRRGAWSLEDEDVPHASLGQRLLFALALLLAAAGTALFIWSYLGHGVG